MLDYELPDPALDLILLEPEWDDWDDDEIEWPDGDSDADWDGEDFADQWFDLSFGRYH